MFLHLLLLHLALVPLHLLLVLLLGLVVPREVGGEGGRLVAVVDEDLVIRMNLLYTHINN